MRSYQDPDRLKPRKGRRGVLEDDQITHQQTAQISVNDSLPPADFSLLNDERAHETGLERLEGHCRGFGSIIALVKMVTTMF